MITLSGSRYNFKSGLFSSEMKVIFVDFMDDNVIHVIDIAVVVVAVAVAVAVDAVVDVR